MVLYYEFLSANLSWKELENSAYFTFRVNGNKIPQWMSADVFDTNSHFPICCLIEHDEWLESEKRCDKWQHLGSIAWPIDSPSLLLLQPSCLLCPPHRHGGSDFFLEETQFMNKGRCGVLVKPRFFLYLSHMFLLSFKNQGYNWWLLEKECMRLL